MSIYERMSKILGTNTSPNLPEEQQESSDAEKEILSSLALAATSLGIDMDDNEALAKFIADVKAAVTKEKSQLKSIFRRFTSTKARTAAKQTIKNV